MKKIDRSSKVRTGFHQAKWDEPVIFELSRPGERGILVPQAAEAVKKETKGVDALPGCCATTHAWLRRPWAPT